MSALTRTRRNVIGTLLREAEEAFERGDARLGFAAGDRLVALQQPRGHEVLAAVHRSVGDDDGALEAVKRGTRAHPDDEQLRRSEIALLCDLARFEEARAAARAALVHFDGRGGLAAGRTLAAVRALLARAILENGAGDREAAAAEAWLALRIDPTCQGAAQVVRAAEASVLTEGWRYRLKLRGAPLHGGQGGQSGYEGAQGPARVTVYMVIAESTARAYELALRFEPAHVRAQMELEECDAVEAAPGEREGVETVLAAFDIPGPTGRAARSPLAVTLMAVGGT